MSCVHTLVLTSLLALLAAAQIAAQAVSLRPNKATDDSVCDLTHDTNAYLGSTVLVPAVASSKDQVDAFFRLAASFVASKCKNGQVLILQGMSNSGVDANSLSQLANSSCSVSAVSRTEITVSFVGHAQPGFELRCPISKHDELVQKLADLERTEPMDSLKARMYAAVQQEQGSGPSGTSSQGKKDCSKVTLASLLQGGSCK